VAIVVREYFSVTWMSSSRVVVSSCSAILPRLAMKGSSLAAISRARNRTRRLLTSMLETLASMVCRSRPAVA
jgi:hypothetical protein